MDYFGPVVNVAARVSGYAGGGQIFVSPDVQSVIMENISKIDNFVIENLGFRTMKGVKDPRNLFRVRIQITTLIIF